MYQIRDQLYRNLSDGVAAGQTVQTFLVDTLGGGGGQSVLFVLHMGAIVAGAVTSAKLQSGNKSDGSDAADISGATVTIADTDDNKLFLLEVMKTTKRYVTLRVSRATQDSTIISVHCVIKDLQRTNILQDDTVGGKVSVVL